MGRISNRTLYPNDNQVSLDDFFIGTDRDNLDATRTYPLSGLLASFKSALNLSSVEYIFSDGTDPTLDENDGGYFTTNSNETSAPAVTAININKNDAAGIAITSLLEVVDDQPTAFTLRVTKPAVAGQVFYFSVTAITDNLDDTYTLTVENFIGSNSLEDGTTYSFVFDLSGVPSVYTETDPIFTASDAFAITSSQITNWDTAFGWGNHASAGYLTEASNATITGTWSFDSVNQIQFNSTNPAHSEGLVFYDGTNAALSYYNDEAEITLQIGQENYIAVRNTTGVTIPNGTAVYVTGAVGFRTTVAPAIANGTNASRCIGLATHDIENNTNGYVTTLGTVNDLDTSAFTAGDQLYLSDTVAGAVINTRPTGTSEIVDLGVCLVSNPANGSIKVIQRADSESAVKDVAQTITGAWTFNEPLVVEGFSITSVKATTWDLAYSWGDHASAGYITAETDPVFIASPAFGIASGDITQWDAAYQWGDHAAAGYVGEVFVTSSTGVGDSGNWTKVARIELSSQYDNATAFISYHNSTNGQANPRMGFFGIRSKQESALGVDPLVTAYSYYIDQTSVDIGYVIVQNTPTSIVDFYVQPNNTFTTIHGTTISVDNEAYITWYNTQAYVTTPAGIVETVSEAIGKTTFLGLNDTPSSYSGQALLGVAVNAGETALEFKEFVDLTTNQYTIGGEKTFTGAVQLFDGRVGVQTPVFGGSRLGDSGFQTPAIDTQTLLFKDTGQATAVGMFATAVGGSDGYVFSFKNFVDDVIVYNISGVGAADYTDVNREVETTFGLRNDYTAGQFGVFDTFNNDYPNGVSTEVRQSQGWVAIHGGGATAKKIGLYRYAADTTTYSTLWEVDASDNMTFTDMTTVEFPQSVTFSGNEINIEGVSPRIDFIETDAVSSNWNIIASGDNLDFRENGTSDTRMRIADGGNVEVFGDLDVNGGQVSQRVFKTSGWVTGNIGLWTKIASVSIGAFAGKSVSLEVVGSGHTDPDGQPYTQTIHIHAKQQATAGNDPYLQINTYYLNDTGFDVGYVITNNNPFPSTIDFYLQGNINYTTWYGYIQSIDDSGDWTWYNNEAIAAAPIGLVETTAIQTWTSANDGAGSGLDADLVRGRSFTSSGDRWDVHTAVDASGVMEIGRYLDFHSTDADTSDLDFRIDAQSDTAMRITSGGATTQLEMYSGVNEFARIGANASGGYLSMGDVGGAGTTILRGYGDSEFYGGNIYAKAGVSFLVENPNNASATLSLSWLSDVARLRVGGSGAGATGGFTIQKTGDGQLFFVDNVGDATFGAAAGNAGAGDILVDNIKTNGTTYWYVSSSDVAHQRADCRDDASGAGGSLESRLHWYGADTSGTAQSFRHAWYDGTNYMYIDYEDNILAMGTDVSSVTNPFELNLKSAVDCGIHIEADVGNSGEGDNPYLKLSQDGDLVNITYALEGTANTAWTGSLDNQAYVKMNQPISRYSIVMENTTAGDIAFDIDKTTGIVFNNELGTGGTWITMESSNSGSNGAEQSAGISLGESGYKGAAAIHMTYTGDGRGYIGMGSVVSGIPTYPSLQFQYQTANWISNGDIDMAANKDLDFPSATGVVSRGVTNTGFLEGSYNRDGSSTSSTGAIYVMGANYRPTATDLSNMYGVGYCYGSALNGVNGDLGTTPANQWGFYVAADGEARLWFNGTSGVSRQKGISYASNFTLNSDRRLKNSIVDYVPRDLGIRWRNFELNSEEGQYRVGVIAQELLETAPELVNKEDPTNYTINNIDLLNAAMAQKDAEIAELKAKNKEQDARLDRLEGLLNQKLNLN